MQPLDEVARAPRPTATGASLSSSSSAEGEILYELVVSSSSSLVDRSDTPVTSHSVAESDIEYGFASASNSSAVDDESKGGAVFVAITDHKTLRRNRSKTTYYSVQVQVGDRKLVVKHRYNDFKDLYRKVR